MSDRVTQDVAETVKLRDGQCVLARLDPMHHCRDQWGEPHSPYDLGRCTLEHVKTELRMGKRAPSDPAHLVTLCGYANIMRVPTKAQREMFRAYLASVAVT
jgi:hypothetical protein